MNHLHRRGLSALLSLLLVGQMLPSALGACSAGGASRSGGDPSQGGGPCFGGGCSGRGRGSRFWGNLFRRRKRLPLWRSLPRRKRRPPRWRRLLRSGRPGPGEVAITPDVFPDDAFRGWLANRANLNGYGADGIFTQEELAGIREIRVPALGIASLEGI